MARLRSGSGFTLIELLVVISIIALLIGILLPALGAARRAAHASISTSNMRQIGIALAAYTVDHEGWYPMMSSVTSTSTVTSGAFSTKPRWPDYLFTYIPDPSVYRSPSLSRDEIEGMTKIFWNELSSEDAQVMLRRVADGGNSNDFARSTPPDVPARHGGYGYNYQYLGNSRDGTTAQDGSTISADTYHGRADVTIRNPSSTLAVGDTAGSRKNDAANTPYGVGEGVYTIDPPLSSYDLGSRGNKRGTVGAYYPSASSGIQAEGPGAPAGAGNGAIPADFGSDDDHLGGDGVITYLLRVFPAERNNSPGFDGTAAFVFLDGHAKQLTLAEVDDSDEDGFKDNGFWNGFGDAGRR